MKEINDFLNLYGRHVLCAILSISFIGLYVWLWWLINVKRPEDKIMEEEKSRITNYDKYKNEIRNLKP